MRKKNYKGVKCTKRYVEKCEGVCKTFDNIQYAYADLLSMVQCFPVNSGLKTKIEIIYCFQKRKICRLHTCVDGTQLIISFFDFKAGKVPSVWE